MTNPARAAQDWGAVLSADLVVHIRVPGGDGRSLCGVRGPFIPVGVVVGTTFCPECLDEWQRMVGGLDEWRRIVEADA